MSRKVIWCGPEDEAALDLRPVCRDTGDFALTGVAGGSAFETFLALRDNLLPWIAEYSPAELLTADNPPMFLDYHDFTLTPTEPADAYYTHSPGFGVGFLQRAKSLARGVSPAFLRPGGRRLSRLATISDRKTALCRAPAVNEPMIGFAATPIRV